MCLSEAGRVVARQGGEAVISVHGVERRVSLAPIVLDGRDVEVGDWVLVHTGLAVDLLDEAAATELTRFSRLVRGHPQEEEP
jgi:hydrogenase expression/formation protein HypC